MSDGPDSTDGRPDPGLVGTVPEYVRELRRLKIWAGNPSLDQLRKLTGFPRSTLSDALNPKRSTLPAIELVRELVVACGCTEGETSKWLDGWRRVAAAQGVRDDPSPESDQRSSKPDSLVPRQLPSVGRHYIGRVSETRALDQLSPTSTSVAATIVAVDGTAGVGKTAFAVHWARTRAERFPDGQLYVNLRGFDPGRPPMSPDEALRGFLDALHVRPERVPATVEAQAGMYRSLLADRRVLVVLDNARDLAQVRPLLPAGFGCMAIVTSRNRLTGLVAAEGAHPVTLDPLDRRDSEQLLTVHLGHHRVVTSREAVAEVIESCSGLPLALAVVASRLAVDPGLSLGTLSEQLAESRLEALEVGDPATDVGAVLSWSYRQLSDQAKRTFRLLGASPTPELSLDAVASLTAVPFERTRPVLRELIDANLVTEQSPDRYGIHDLLRSYAASLAQQQDSRDEQTAAMDRILAHYLHSAHRSARLLQPNREPIPLPPLDPDVAIARLANRDQALAWMDSERAGLLGVVGFAAEQGHDQMLHLLAWCLTGYLDLYGYGRDLVVVQRAALAAAERLGDSMEVARANRDLARAYLHLREYGEARARLEHAVMLFEELGEDVEQAHAYFLLIVLSERLPEPDHREGLAHAQRALELYRRRGYRVGEAKALNAVGWSHAQNGDLENALDNCEQALALLRELGDPNGEADTWDSLGWIHHHLGDVSRAVGCYRRAVALYEELGSPADEASTLVSLGETEVALGAPEAARTAWQRARAILERLDDPDAAGVRDRLRRLNVRSRAQR